MNHSLQLLHHHIKEKTGISLPTYYNAGVINPLKFAEQEQKRKLLWSREEEDKKVEKTEKKTATKLPTAPTIWKNLKFEGEQGNQMTEKFRKLMGIKGISDNSEKTKSTESSGDDATNTFQDQTKLFRNLDMQYSAARMSTHTHRGVGLGFSSASSSATSQRNN